MDNFSITKQGKPLSKDKYTIDYEKKVFTSKEDNLDFRGCSGWTFTTGGHCTFKVAGNCTFTTGGNCTFDTGNSCTFATGVGCTFNTYDGCTFYTSGSCIFKTGDGCIFRTTYDNCTFLTGNGCTFKTGNYCTFSLWDINTCKFKSYDGYSIILDRLDKKHYLLTKEFLALQKVKNG